jgi:GntR family transcriptional regulator, trigonelline degradation regulator
MKKLEDAFASGDRRRIRQQTSRYYDVLLEGSGNRFVGDMIRGLQARVTFLRSTSMSHPDRAPASLAEMQRITKAIQRRDPKAAEAACRAHIEAARDAALAMLVKGMPTS